MMSLRSWLILLVFYVLYLVIGGLVFRALEKPVECQGRIEEFSNRARTISSLDLFKGEFRTETRLIRCH